MKVHESKLRMSDRRVLEAQPYFSDEQVRVVFRFGNMLMDAVTLCHVPCVLKTSESRDWDTSGRRLDGEFWGDLCW